MDKVVINQLPVEQLRGRRVFVRIDADTEQSSADGLFDESKLRACLPTLAHQKVEPEKVEASPVEPENKFKQASKT